MQQRLDRGQADRAGRTRVQAGQAALGRGDAFLDLRRGGDGFLAVGRRRIALARAFEQAHPERALDRVHAPEHGGMADAQALGRAVERAGSADREQEAIVVPGQGRRDVGGAGAVVHSCKPGLHPWGNVFQH
nr:hypothetical protein [Lysobacter enzymogenes]